VWYGQRDNWTRRNNSFNLILNLHRILFFFLFFFFANSNYIRGPYRVFEIKHSLSHTQPNRGVGVNNLFSLLFYLFIYWLLVWYESLIGPKRGMILPTWVTPCIRLNLRPKLKGKTCRATYSYLYWQSNFFFPFFLLFYKIRKVIILMSYSTNSIV